MKKLTVIAFAFASFGLIATEANAQTAATEASTQAPAATTTTTQPATAATQTATGTTAAEKVKIEEAQLPEAVKTSMKAEAFKDWQVAEVYKVAPDASTAGATATYEVYFTNAEQKKAIARFDEAGKPVRKAADAAAATETQK